MHFLLSLIINAAILMLAAYIMPRVEIRSFGAALLVAFLIGILNPTVGLLLRFLLHVATLGIPLLLGLGFIIRWIVSAIVIKIVDALVGGFKVHGFGAALILALVMAILGTLVDYMLGM